MKQMNYSYVMFAWMLALREVFGINTFRATASLSLLSGQDKNIFSVFPLCCRFSLFSSIFFISPPHFGLPGGHASCPPRKALATPPSAIVEKKQTNKHSFANFVSCQFRLATSCP